ncbi:MAG: ABC transporter substrate-binding protein [candidate division Zixibacteria bacterium]|nr:ABC transporter substrate-binding protein [candidate division Zixibacteria bacterium]
MLRKTIRILLSAVIALLLVGTSTVDAAEVLKIGALFPMTGDLSRLGIDSFQGAELARIVQNEMGGLLGKKIVFVRGDAVTPKAAMTEAERLITIEGVDIILGTYSSSRSYAASEVAEKYGKIYWEQGAVSNKITERGLKNLFRLCPKSSQYAEFAMNFVVKGVCPKIAIDPKKLRLAVVFEDSLYGTTTGEFVLKQCEKLGINMVASESYSAKATDLSSLVMKLKDAKPDVLVGTQYLTDGILFWRQAKELNFNVKAFVGTGGGPSMYDYGDALGDDATGVIDTSFCPPSDTVNRNYAPGVEEFLKKYRQVFKQEITSVYPPINYTHSMVLWDVIKRAGSTDPKAVRKAAFQTDIPDQTTVTGYGIKFDSTGQNIRARVILEQWQDRKLYPVWPPQAASPGREAILPMPKWEERPK